MKETKKSPGRPKDSLKHNSPITNEPIPATQYYKEVRMIKRLQKTKKRNSEYTKVYKSETLNELMAIRDSVEGLIKKELAFQSVTA